MKEVNIVRQLSHLYGFDEREALILIGVDNNDVSEKSEYELNVKTTSVEVKAFDGIVKKECCQAVIYNHGLYTQCPNICKNEFCSSQCKRKKYGHINVRKNFPAGTYVLEDGRREKKLDKIKSGLKKRESEKGIDIEKVKNDIELEREKQTRGRPKRNKSIDIREDVRDEESDERDSDTEEIEVRKEVIDGKEYLVSRMNIVYDRETLKIIGRKRDGRLNLLEM